MTSVEVLPRIRKARYYFFYNIDLISDAFFSESFNPFFYIDDIIEKLEKKGYGFKPIDVPGFYTLYFKTHVAPKLLDIGYNYVYIDAEKLKEIDFFQDIPVEKDIKLFFEILVFRTGIGIIRTYFEVENPPSDLAHRLSCIYLNPRFKIIRTRELRNLLGDSAPDYVSMDEFIGLLFDRIFGDLAPRRTRYKALRHEIQIPLITLYLDVDKSLDAFMEENREFIVRYIFKPECWEVSRASSYLVRELLTENHLWSVSDRAFFVTAYEGGAYILLSGEVGSRYSVSDFYLADEYSVVFTFMITIANYHHLRLLDFLLDKWLQEVSKEVEDLITGVERTKKNAEYVEPLLRKLAKMLDKLANIQSRIHITLEGISNADKLIDEEWHIILFNKISKSLGLDVWLGMIREKMNHIAGTIITLERSRENIFNVGLLKGIYEANVRSIEVREGIDKLEGIFVGIAVLELITIFAEIWYGSLYYLGLVYGKIVTMFMIVILFVLSIVAVYWFIKKTFRSRET